MINVVIVDDHSLHSRGLRELLSETGSYRVVGEAADYEQWINISARTTCDVLIVAAGIARQDDMGILLSAPERHGNVRTLVMSGSADDTCGIRCLTAGAKGYVEKNAEPNEILKAVDRVAQDQIYASPALSAKLVDSLKSGRVKQPHDSLSERETQTLLYIAKGAKRAEIAEALCLSPKTISVYRARVMEKLGLTTDAALAAYAVRHNLLD
jgi:DNA-binding NarL/FixJ family response regulator